MPAVALPAQRPVAIGDGSELQTGATNTAQTARFIKGSSYSGPTAGVHVEQDARDGKKIFIDRDFAFAGLPADLNGADYVQASAADARYNAVDLMEVAVKAGSMISVAHDDRLARPDWLTRQFKATEAALVVDGHSMKVFQYNAANDESLTLGTNTEDANA